ncbi:MAG: hypothetical protein GC179_18585 [Anaerolineaceae bacterium]|nr:hypothetical protein [Anaerolineaceae bacterium]
MVQKVDFIDPEQVAYWFFRLQGCLTITNYMLHRFDEKGKAYSDGDVIAVRFPYREEGSMHCEESHFSSTKIDFSIVEVKYRNSPTTLNDSWTFTYGDKTLRAILERTGLFQSGKTLDEIVTRLYKDWIYENDSHRVRVLTVAKNIVETPTAEMPLSVSQQLTWKHHVLPFIHKRFTRHADYKNYHPQWDKSGQQLYEWSIRHRNDENRFIDLCTAAMDEYQKRKNRK